MNFDKYNKIFLTYVPPIAFWPLRCFHLSAAIYKNRIISIARNENKTHTINLRNRKYNKQGIDFSATKLTCSEWVCLNQVKRRTNIPFNKIVLINFRINREGIISNAHPCCSCESLLAWLEPKAVYYTDDKGNYQKYNF